MATRAYSNSKRKYIQKNQVTVGIGWTSDTFVRKVALIRIIMTAHFNLFRLFGDLLHVWSIFVLLLKVMTSKNCKGLSLKTQALYLLVFLTRYTDLFFDFISVYNTCMKLLFIGSSGGIVYLMKFKEPYNRTYDEKIDSFPVSYLIVPCAVLALVWHEAFTITEILWAFSLFLEAVAIVPQIFVVHALAKESNGFVESLTSNYVFSLGGYRALYLLNWIYKYAMGDHHSNWIVWIPGVVQTAIYCDFFYYYLLSIMEGRNVVLPV